MKPMNAVLLTIYIWVNIKITEDGKSPQIEKIKNSTVMENIAEISKLEPV